MVVYNTRDYVRTNIVQQTSCLLFLLVWLACWWHQAAMSQPALQEDYLNDLELKYTDSWPLERMPIRVFVRTGEGIPGYRASFLDFLQQSLQEWSVASRGRISFVLVPDVLQSDIVVTWSDGSSYQRNSAEMGATKISRGKNGIKCATIVLFTMPTAPRLSLPDKVVKLACLHEIGHSLGLSGHSKNSKDIMALSHFLTVDTRLEDIALTPRDSNTLLRLYKEIQANQAQWVALRPQSGDLVRLNNEGTKAIRQNDFIAAIQKLEAAFEIDKDNRVVQENLEGAYWNYAVTFLNAEKYSDAVPLLQRVLEIDKRLFSLKHPETLKKLEAYAYCLHRLNRNAEYIPYNTNKQLLSNKIFKLRL